jgi:diguanylate cyclase (GGDEF)-like protein
LEVQRESDVVHVATQLVNRIAESFEFNGTVLSITSSIGIAMYPEDGETAEILFKKADIAMYEAKGTNRRVFLSSSHGF